MDRREMKDPGASLDLLVPSVCRVFQDHLARKVKMEMLVLWVLLVHQVPEDLRVLLVLMARKVLLEE